MSLPKKCLVDTNVPKTANLATQLGPDSEVSDACVLACIEAIEHVIKQRGLIIDVGGEIFDEYRQQLSMKGQPGIGDRFMKWVHDNRWSLPDAHRVTITRNGELYEEFPTHDGLNDFDRSDRKFVAVANAHAGKPPIASGGDGRMPWLRLGLPFSSFARNTSKLNMPRRWERERGFFQISLNASSGDHAGG